MLTGRRAFQGDDVTDVLVAVMSKEPDWTRVASSDATAPSGDCSGERSNGMCTVVWLISPTRRLELEDALTTSADEIVSAPPPRVALVAQTRAARRHRTRGRRSCRRGGVDDETGCRLHAPSHALRSPFRQTTRSRPLKRLATSSPCRLMARGSRTWPMGGFTFVPVNRLDCQSAIARERGDVRSSHLTGNRLGFWNEGQFRKVSVNGGAACPYMRPTPFIWGATWEPDDTILYGLGPDGIWRVPAAGGKPEQVDQAGRGPACTRPAVPSRRTRRPVHARAGADRSWDDAQIVVQSLDGGSRHVVIQGGTDARYLPTGHLVYARGGSLLALPFDLAGN